LDPRKPLHSLFGVAALCSPIVPYVILAEMSRNLNSPAWILTALPTFTLLASVPIAGIVALVATIRRRAPGWSLILMWIMVLFSVLIFFSIQPKNPFTY